MDEHDAGPGHPERPARLAAVERGVQAAGLGDALVTIEGRRATRPELERVHDPAYLQLLEDVAASGGGYFDAETAISSGSWRSARAATGAALAAVEAMTRGDAAAAFVAGRPPGHHATPSRAMGFCLLNTVAVAAAALAERGERVLIVDWDVHHGNGTQDIFWDDPRVLYASLHQSPAYPGTGEVSEIGGPNAPGLIVNIPLPPGATGDVALAALDEVIAPAADAFGPTWVLVSCGFDAHRADPLAHLMLSAGDYADLTNRVAALSAGPTLMVFEGGYDLDAIAGSSGAVASALTGGGYRPEPSTSGGPGKDAVGGVRQIRAELLGSAG